jgi:DNA-directed RNA polymerase specialized sigma24 family protein
MSRYILNFDPEKSTNPFAYFTQITHYAFLRRIKLEKRETEKKAMIIERLNFDEVMSDDGQNMDNYSDYSSIRDNVYSRMRP